MNWPVSWSRLIWKKLKNEDSKTILKKLDNIKQ
jgi:hypothetical protein